MSAITTYDLRELEAPPIQETARMRAWGGWTTLAWFGVAMITYLAAGTLVLLAYLLWSAHQNSDANLNSPLLTYLVSMVAMPLAAWVLIHAARRREAARSYFALAWPAWRHILIGLVLIAIAWIAIEGLFYLFPSYDQSPELIAEYREILGNPMALAMFWLVLVVTAPVSEELIFRGFLYRGWSETRLGSVGAVFLVALLFALVHVQYNILGMFMVFCVGLICGVMRWRSGSVLVPIVMHATWNLICGIYCIMSA